MLRVTAAAARRVLSVPARRFSGVPGAFLDPTNGLDDERAEIYSMARDFGEREWLPHAAEWDAKESLPVDKLVQAAELGFGAIYCDEKYGGTGLGRLEAALVFEALSMACPSTTALLSIHNMCAWMIDTFGTDEQRQAWLPDLATCSELASYCLTEPGSGSDAAALQTKAVRDGDHYIVNGSKAFISGASSSSKFLVMVRTGDDTPRGISCLVIDKDTPGLSLGKKEHKLGWNSQPTHAVIMEDARVPVANLLGGEGQGFKIAMKGLDGGRINIAACSVGGAAQCIDLAKEHLRVRKQFGKPLAAMQHLQFKMADLGVALHASRMLVRDAAQQVSAKTPGATAAAAAAKVFATDACFNIVNESLQMHGGYGYLKEYPIERYLRDLRVHQILEGTNQIMRMIISRQMLA